MRITLVGSTRFAAKFLVAMEALTLDGHTVYGLGYNSSHKEDGEGKGPDEKQKVILDLVHLKKILDSDAVVLVTDDSLYFGQSTQRELAWAALLNKPTYIGHDGLSAEVKLITPEALKEEMRQREQRRDMLKGAMLGGAVPMGSLLRSLAERGGLPGEFGGDDEDDEEGGGHGHQH